VKASERAGVLPVAVQVEGVCTREWEDAGFGDSRQTKRNFRARESV